MQAVFSRFSLKVQIGSLVALAGLILVTLLAVLFVGQANSDRAAAVAAKEETTGRHAESLDRALAGARRREKDFLLRNDAKYVAEHAEFMRVARAELDAMVAAMDPDDQHRARADGVIRKGIATYDEAFRLAAAGMTRVGLTEGDGLLGALRASVHQIETALEAHDDPRLTVLMLMMRRHEKDFFARHDAKYIGELDRRVAEFDKALTGSDLAASERAILRERLAAYHRDFKAAAEASLAVLAEIKVLSDTYVAIEPEIQVLDEGVEKEMLAARQEALRIDEVSIRTMTVVTLIGFVVMVVLGGTIARSIYSPITALAATIARMAKGDLTVTVPGAGRHDEIGVMAGSVSQFKDDLTRIRQLEAEQEEQKRRAEADRLTAMRKMADTFEDSVGKVIETVTSAATELQAASSQMAGTATETSTQATTVASAAQQASANVQTVASATEQLAASIKEIAHQVERSLTVSARAGEEATATTTQVRALSDNVGRIGEIVNLINDIAAQTNLLALNATIEAARAGDAGKGFAVVANEVKHLANQTAHATSEIAGQIQAVQQSTDAAVQAIDSITTVIGEMGEISSAVAAAVEQQSSATNEIARNVEQAAVGTQEVTGNITSVEQAAKETGAAAEQIRESSTDLSRQAEFLRHEVGQFLAQVRADKKDVTLLRWEDSLDMGVASVDGYHRKIFDLVNEFYRRMMGGEGGEGATVMLSQLGNSVQIHFGEEEALMAARGYHGAEHHRGAHKAFLARIEGLRAEVEAKNPEVVAEFFDYAAKWLGDHIRKDDKAFGTFLRGQGMAA